MPPCHIILTFSINLYFPWAWFTNLNLVALWLEIWELKKMFKIVQELICTSWDTCYWKCWNAALNIFRIKFHTLHETKTLYCSMACEGEIWKGMLQLTVLGHYTNVHQLHNAENKNVSRGRCKVNLPLWKCAIIIVKCYYDFDFLIPE